MISYFGTFLTLATGGAWFQGYDPDGETAIGKFVKNLDGEVHPPPVVVAIVWPLAIVAGLGWLIFFGPRELGAWSRRRSYRLPEARVRK